MLGRLLPLLGLLAGLAGAVAQAQTVPVPPELVAQAPDDPDGRLGHVLRRGTLIVGVKTDYPPWGMLDIAGNAVGLEADLARDLADRLEVGLELRPVTAGNRIGRVNQGQVDLVIATTGDTYERRLQADLLQPGYYSAGVVLYGRADLALGDWSALRGRPVCLNRGAYYNRALEQDYGLDGQYFTGNRESRLALLYGRCVGWAFDDTILTRMVRDAPSDDLAVMKQAILVSPWVAVVARGEGERDLGRFVSDMIGEWHASGRILELQDKWDIPRTGFLEDKHALWSRRGEDGRALCARQPETGRFPAECLDPPPLRSVPAAQPPDWMQRLDEATGINLSVLADAYDRGRLIRGLGLTLALAGMAIVGALTVGVVLGLLHVILSGRGWIGRLLLLPQRLLVTVSRMTPPILQLYIVFFGLGGVLANSGAFTPGAFVISTVIFSLYAGSTNTVILSHALEHERGLHPDRPALRLLPMAIERGYDGLVASCVNIVKAAGMASAIAVGELISTVNLLVSEGADTRTLMNGLLLFYFLFVLGIVWLFGRAKSWLVRP
ncbi:transporter substrate-binding domain-containing protein [Paracoccus marinaquae]|uniref:Transporter substrate-binding domain-containing protein n=1 Tax=Paracoccus marinaquae TaxID=2841926 RepID=A0ABS6AHN0_9RHOB|nr:transporter substrate-binding domain-containing protein [Paracoccus marinaquae]MBU3030110.1 transporter substrate-binding domain-containing protein [Paracoccus marinaquae]